MLASASDTHSLKQSSGSSPMRTSNAALYLAIATMAALSASCSSTPSSSAGASPATTTSSSSAAAAPRIVKSRDGSFEGQIFGTPAVDSKFSKLLIGMQTPEVQDMMGRAPDRSHSYESGKRWIPFYFGNDARRLQALYKGEGCLTFTNGNIWGGSGGDLIQITVDPSGACYQP